MGCTEESFDLTEEQIPTIPEPHDCVIREIVLEGEWLVFNFENEISNHDSVSSIHPHAQTLTMKIQLSREDNIELLAYEHRKYERVYVVRKPGGIFDLVKKSWRLEYLYHKVSHGSMQIELARLGATSTSSVCMPIALYWNGRSKSPATHWNKERKPLAAIRVAGAFAVQSGVFPRF